MKIFECNSSFFLILIFVLSVFVDNLNGYFQIQKGIFLPIGVLYRIIVLAILFLSLIRYVNNSASLLLLPFLIIILLFVWDVQYSIDFFYEIESLFRLYYLYLFILYFRTCHYDKSLIYKYISIHGFLVSLVIIFCFVFKVGNNSYGEYYGFGTKGFFIAGNDLGISVVFSLVYSFLYYILYKRTIFSIFCTLVIVCGSILIGSRVGIILSLLISLCFFVYILFILKNQSAILKLTLALLMLIVMPLFLIEIYNLFDEYTLNRMTVESIRSARGNLIYVAKQYIDSFTDLSSLVGKGTQNLYRFVGENITGGEKSVESDYYDLVGGYGYGVAYLIYAYFVYYVVVSLYRFWRNKNVESFSIFMLTFMFLFVGYLAGHAMRNVMLAPLYAVTIAVIVRRDSIQRKIIE